MTTRGVPTAVSICLLVLACSLRPTHAGTWTADNGNGTFSNPLFYDEFSDCDLIRVGRDFYLTGTTMHSMPGLPVLHSRDLVNWRFLSYALDRLDLGPAFRLENGKHVYGQGDLGAKLPVSQGHLLHLQQRERPDHATLPRQGPRRSVDAERDEAIVPRSLSPVRR